ncbi:MAG: hypothetical protein DGJ47_000887 [Rickettsiaceae bacterium]
MLTFEARERLKKCKSYIFIVLTLIFLVILGSVIFNGKILAEEKKIRKPFILLTIDGGGVRGIIPATILAEIEKRTQRPIYQMVDMIAGNSTGGIIALGLTMPDDNDKLKNKYTANDLVNLYKNKSSKIFEKSFWRRLKTGYGTWGEKYDRTNLDQILKNQFANATLKEVIKPVLVFSYILELGEGRIFGSNQAKVRDEANFYLRDVAAATSAAPTYFSPVKISNVKKTPVKFESGGFFTETTEIDGGVFANNPAMLSASCVLKRKLCKPKDLIIISLGTGTLESKQFASPKTKGTLGWGVGANIIDLILSATEDVSKWSSEALGFNLHRLQLRLNAKDSAMDDSSKENIDRLIAKTNQFIKENDKVIDKICKILNKSI